MPKLLSDEQTSAWPATGIVFPVPVLNPEDVTHFAAGLAQLEERLGGRPTPAQLAEVHLFFRWAYDLVTHPAVLDGVEDVLGPNILVWACSVFTKYPHDASFVSWHQDGTYWGLDEGQVVTAWIALTPSTTENGCMRVVPGTHTNAIRPHRETYAPNNLLSRGQEIQVNVDESEAVDVVLEPGEMSLHDVRLIHGSNPNPSPQKRAGVAVRYITPDVRQTGTQQTVILARGQDAYGYSQALEEPPDDDFDAAIASHARAAQAHLQALRQTDGAF